MGDNGRQKEKKTWWKDLLKFVVFFGIGVLFVYWFLLKLDSEQKQAIWESFSGANYWWVALAMAVSLLSHYVRALRWKLLFSPLGENPSRNNVFGAVMVAYLSNLAFPRLGEVMRCAMLRNSDKIAVEKSLGTVVSERLFDVLCFGIIVVIGLLVMFGKAKDWLYDALSQKFATLPSLWLVIAIGVAVAAAAVILYVSQRKKLLKHKWFAKIDKIITGALAGLKSIFQLSRRQLVLFLLYSVVLYFLYILGGFVIFQAMEETSGLGLRAAFVIYLFGSVGMMISQGGLGAYPVLCWQALDIYGVSEVGGLAYGWLLWSSQQAVVLVVGMAYMVYFAVKKKKINTETNKA